MQSVVDVLGRVAELLASSNHHAATRTRNGVLVVKTRGATTPLSIVAHERGDERAAVVLAWICTESQAPARRMLELAMSIGSGAIGLVSGAYWLRCTIPATMLSAERLETVLDYARDIAVSLARQLPIEPALAHDNPFLHFA